MFFQNSEIQGVIWGFIIPGAQRQYPLFNPQYNKRLLLKFYDFFYFDYKTSKLKFYNQDC